MKLPLHLRLFNNRFVFPFVFGYMWWQMAKDTEGKAVAAAGSVFAFGAAVYLTIKGENPELEFTIAKGSDHDRTTPR